MSSDRLNPNEQLLRGENIVANSGNCSVEMQEDGNLVLYALRSDGFWHALWASNTNGLAVANCVMQGDGNLVMYGFPKPLWDSKTWGHNGAFAVIQDDENFVIYGPDGTALWASNTFNPNPFTPPPCSQMRASAEAKHARAKELRQMAIEETDINEKKKLLQASGREEREADALDRLIAIKC